MSSNIITSIPEIVDHRAVPNVVTYRKNFSNIKAEIEALQAAGGGSGGIGYTGSQGMIGYTGSAGIGYIGSIGGDLRNLSYVRIGDSAAMQTNSILIGAQAHSSSVENCNVVIGHGAAAGGYSVCIGNGAGSSSPINNNSVAIGAGAGAINQVYDTVAIGRSAGGSEQQHAAIAIGNGAGSVWQGTSAVAVGAGAGASHQGNYTTAVGAGAGAAGQGNFSVAIGYMAGASGMPPNSILIKADGLDAYSPQTEGFFVKPVRNLTSPAVMCYDPTSGEMSYSTDMTIGYTGSRGDVGYTGSAGAGSGKITRRINVTYNSVVGTVTVVATGSQSDIDALAFTVSAGGNGITMVGDTSNINILSISVYIPVGFNSTTAFSFTYTDSTGATSLADLPLPTMTHYLASGAIGPTVAIISSMVGSTVTITKSSLTAMTSYYFTYRV